MKEQISGTLKLDLAATVTLARRKVGLAVCAILCTVPPGLSASTDEATIMTFDAPGAGTGSFQGTFPTGINPSRAITGSYTDTNSTSHGFLRDPDGTITTFDPPGSIYTSPSGINSSGETTGSYLDMNGFHGFLRDRDGTITMFDLPGAIATFPFSINPSGATTGYFFGQFGQQGFVRDGNGMLISFDAPVGGNNPSPDSINPSGAVTGQYFSFNPVQLQHCFLRDVHGNLTTIDPPGSVDTFGCVINPAGVITGPYCDAAGGHGFLRDQNGTYTSFDVPGAVENPGECFLGGEPTSINPSGAVAGPMGTQASAFMGSCESRTVRLRLSTLPAPSTGTSTGPSRPA